MNLFKRNRATASREPSIYEGDRSITAGRSGSLRSTGGALMDRATQVYRKNPKMVGGAALLGAVALLGLVKNRGLR